MAYGDNIDHPQSPWIALQAYIADHHEQYSTDVQIDALYNQLGIPVTAAQLKGLNNAQQRDLISPYLNDQMLSTIGVVKNSSTGEYTLGGVSAAEAIAANDAAMNPGGGTTTSPTSTPTYSGGSSSSSSSSSTSKPSVSAPMSNLTPGMSGASVKQLQNFLIANGYNIPDGATGYYGNETKAAVLQWQKDNGVDYSSGPGYWGPKSISTYQSSVTKSGPFGSGSSSTGAGGAAPSDSQILQTLEKMGYSSKDAQTLLSSMNPMQKALFGAVSDTANTLMSTSSNGITLNDAINAAKNNPQLVAKYADELKLDKGALTDSFNSLRASIADTATQQQQQFQQERQQLAETSASQGQAYSGFRNLAQNQLASRESAVISSTNAQNQAQLNNLLRSFEAKYGSAATSAMALTAPNTESMTGISGGYQTPAPFGTTYTATPAGGITGTEPIAKEQDVLNLAENYFNVGQVPTV